MCDISAKNETFEQHWFDVGLASYHAGPTSSQHCFNVPCLLCFAENVSGILFTVLDLFIYVNWQRYQQSSDDKPRLFYGFNASRWLGSNLFSYKKYFWFNVTKPRILLDHTDCTVSLLRYVSHVSHCRTCQGQQVSEVAFEMYYSCHQINNCLKLLRVLTGMQILLLFSIEFSWIRSCPACIHSCSPRICSPIAIERLMPAWWHDN